MGYPVEPEPQPEPVWNPIWRQPPALAAGLCCLCCQTVVKSYKCVELYRSVNVFPTLILFFFLFFWPSTLLLLFFRPAGYFGLMEAVAEAAFWRRTIAFASLFGICSWLVQFQFSRGHIRDLAQGGFVTFFGFAFALVGASMKVIRFDWAMFFLLLSPSVCLGWFCRKFICSFLPVSRIVPRHSLSNILYFPS